jgi:hypothetical protein
LAGIIALGSMVMTERSRLTEENSMQTHGKDALRPFSMELRPKVGDGMKG